MATLTHTTRRAVLASAPAIAAAAALPAVAAASAPVLESEIMQAFRAWKIDLDRYDSSTFTADEGERLAALRYAEEDRILAMPARTAQDVLAKLVIISLGGEVDPTGHTHGDSVFAEARALTGWDNPPA